VQKPNRTTLHSGRILAGIQILKAFHLKKIEPQRRKGRKGNQKQKELS